jgi:hypothetical protein
MPTITGKIETIKLERRKPYMPVYYSTAEHYEMVLEVCLRLADNSAVYFKVNTSSMCVASCPGAAVVTYGITNAGRGFVAEIEGSGVATPGNPNKNGLRLLHSVGDTITITGTLKAAKVSKAGKPYQVLNRVKLIPNSVGN